MTGARLPTGIATSAAVPALDEDAAVLLDAFRQFRVACVVEAWADAGVGWEDLHGVLVRSTWDYPLRRGEFLRWAWSCRRTANSAEVLGWNTEKQYLRDLSAAGVPVGADPVHPARAAVAATGA